MDGYRLADKGGANQERIVGTYLEKAWGPRSEPTKRFGQMLSWTTGSAGAIGLV